MKTLFLTTIILSLMNTLVLFDFTKDADLKNWNVVDDRVMGGVSQGKMQMDDEGHGLFQGHVSIENNGGFSSIRYVAGKTKLNGYSKFVIKLKGDGKAYQFRVKTKRNDYYSYTFDFKTSGSWEAIEIPFDKLIPAFRGRTLNMVNFPGESLEEIGFLIGNKKEEDFLLRLDEISVQ